MKEEINDDLLLDNIVVRLKRCLAIAEQIDTSPSSESAQLNLLKNINIVQYTNETEMADIMRLITNDLSEPYSIYTYRYFINTWPELCLLACDSNSRSYIGAIVCKLDVNRHNRRRGYIAMLAVDENYRRLRIGESALMMMQISIGDNIISAHPEQFEFVNIGSGKIRLVNVAFLKSGSGKIEKLSFNTDYGCFVIGTHLVEQAIANMQISGCDEVVLETEVTNTNALRLYENLGFIREKRLFRYYLNGIDAFRLIKLFSSPNNGLLFGDSAY